MQNRRGRRPQEKAEDFFKVSTVIKIFYRKYVKVRKVCPSFVLGFKVVLHIFDISIGYRYLMEATA